MEKIDEAIYLAMRDDATATVGLRALLGNTTVTPYNVYHSHLPAAIDFTPASGQKGFVVYSFVSGALDNAQQSRAGQVQESLYNITVYHRLLPSLEAIHRRIKQNLYHLWRMTLPTSQAELHQVKLDSEGPHVWDDAFKVHYQTKIYRVWGRDNDMP